MASIKKVKRKRGATAFQIVYSVQGVKKYLSLGSLYPPKEVEQIKSIVEKLVAADVTGCPLDRRATAWLAASSADLRRRLERSGLIVIEHAPTVDDVLSLYWSEELDKLKERSQRTKEMARRVLLEYFPATTKVTELTKSRVSEFSTKLDARYAPATRAGLVRDIRRFFNYAVERERIKSNPFESVAVGSYANKEREYFVSLDDFEKMLEVCPSQELRTILTLYRIGGLRRGEVFAATWSDVDWKDGKMLVHSQKTERHAGHESRIIPLFPALRRELSASFKESADKSSAIVNLSDEQIRLRVEKIIKLAGLTKWPRLFQNLRSSRSNEVVREFGTIAEATWIGHSQRTASAHYLHILDAEYEKATYETTHEDMEKRQK